jgi:hypothetical protein
MTYSMTPIKGERVVVLHAALAVNAQTTCVHLACGDRIRIHLREHDQSTCCLTRLSVERDCDSLAVIPRLVPKLFIRLRFDVSRARLQLCLAQTARILSYTECAFIIYATYRCARRVSKSKTCSGQHDVVNSAVANSTGLVPSMLVRRHSWPS